MERKISSSFTEFYKVYGILSVIMVFIFFGYNIFNSSDFLFSILYLLILILSLVTAFDFWKMKEVEITDSGLIITNRFFFTQKTIFVPYEKIKTVKNKLWWLGNNKRVTICFTENTYFGNEISFICNKFMLTSQAKLVEKLNQTVRKSKTPERLNSAFHS